MDDLKLIKEFHGDAPSPGPEARSRVARKLERAIVAEKERLGRRRPREGASLPRRTESRRPRHRVLGLSAVGGAVLIAAAVLGVLLLWGGNGAMSPDSAYAAEAVKKAAADTAAAGASGVINSVVLENGVIIQDKTFSWNGDDFAIQETTHESPNPNADKGGGNEESYAELRYVDDQFCEKGWYIAPAGTQWYHCTLWDNGGAVGGFNPSEWLPEARSDLLGEGLVDLVTSASGFSQTVSENGEHVYTGTLTVAELAEHDLGLSGSPFAGSPAKGLIAMAEDGAADSRFRSGAGGTPVTIGVAVGPDGLIRSATISYTMDILARMKPSGRALSEEEQKALGYVSDYTYDITYGDLGSAPAIAPPDAAQTITTDKPEGYRVK